MNLGPRKVCLVGNFFVGKTSTAARFHKNTFDEKYLATVGVSVNTRDVQVRAGDSIRLVVWDLASMDALTPLNINYLRSAAAIVLVADATRRPTLEHALNLHAQIDVKMPALPYVMLINKIDLVEAREIGTEDIARSESLGIRCFETSAKTGAGVSTAFEHLAQTLAGA